MTIPPKNASDDLIFFRCTKNRNVRSRPIIQANPHINKICGNRQTCQSLLCQSGNLMQLILTFPMASNPLSNSSSTPRNTNATPNPAKPTPISTMEWVNNTFVNYSLSRSRSNAIVQHERLQITYFVCR